MSEPLPALQAAARDGQAVWLSILVPVFDVAPYLSQCLRSILRQLPSRGVEIILLDDASTDGSLELCREFAANHHSITLLAHARNRGLSAARNAMLDAARGAYIWFVDSDDEMQPGAIASLHDVVTHQSPDMVLCDYRRQGRHMRSFRGPARTLRHDREQLVRGIFASRRMHSWSKITRRELWGADLRFPVGQCFEDIMTTPWLCLRARSFYYVDEPWISYRVRAGSITATAARSRTLFDERKNDDLAGALSGFMGDARAALPAMSIQTRYCISGFWAKEFTKISWRLLRTRLRTEGWSSVVGKLRRYRATMEPSSPTPFARLITEHLRNGRFTGSLKLGLLLLVTGRTVLAGHATPHSKPAFADQTTNQL